ncbi:MAG: FecR family protein [Candidatus Rokuibacteriota bacterium]
MTSVGQRAIVQLTDGTQLTLAPRSRLRYARDFGERSREVHLEGEAYFDVPHDTTRPFRVHTRGVLTEDLGTAFAVTAYPDEATTTVLVASGRVATRRTDDAAGAATDRVGSAAPRAVVLDRGDLARLSGTGGVLVTRGVDVERHLAWTTGTLVFDSAPLGEVIRTLARWYDLDVRLTDRALAARPLTATFRHEPVSQVLDRIALTLDLRVERDGRSVLFRPNDQKQPAP